MRIDINLKAVTSVLVNKSVISSNYSYKKERKSFWSNKPEGIYDRYGDYEGTIEEFLKRHKGHQVIDNIVYEKPEVVILLSDGKRTTIFFDSLAEAIAKAAEIETLTGNPFFNIPI